MSAKARDQFDKLFTSKATKPRQKPLEKPPKPDNESPAGRSTGYYVTRETEAGLARIADWLAKKHGVLSKHGTKSNHSLALRHAVAAFVQALDTETPDFELPSVDLKSRNGS